MKMEHEHEKYHPYVLENSAETQQVLPEHTLGMITY